MADLAFQRSLPKKRMAAGALLLNEQGDLLIVKPTYRDDWLVPGGVVEADESPREACVRELREEIGLTIAVTSLLCIDYQHSDAERTESLQFIFDGGMLVQEQIAQIVLPPDELARWAFVPYAEAIALVNERLGQRIAFALPARNQGRTAYLEDGVPIAT